MKRPPHFASRPPARVETEPVSVPVRERGKWFGQLRQIYHGDDRIENTQRGPITQVAPRAGPPEFEAILSQLELSPQSALVLNSDLDLDRGAAIVTVAAGARNLEARALLEQY
jgi:hypothetical protein